VKNNVFYNNVHGWSVHRYSGGGSGMTSLYILGNTFDTPNPNRVGQIVIAGPTSDLRIMGNVFNNSNTAGIYLDASDGGTWSGALISQNLSTNAVVYGGTASGSGNLTGTNPQFIGGGDYH